MFYDPLPGRGISQSHKILSIEPFLYLNKSVHLHYQEKHSAMKIAKNNNIRSKKTPSSDVKMKVKQRK